MLAVVPTKSERQQEAYEARQRSKLREYMDICQDLSTKLHLADVANKALESALLDKNREIAELRAKLAHYEGFTITVEDV